MSHETGSERNGWRARTAVCLAVAVCFAASVFGAAPTPEEKKKKEEEALRQEALKTAMTVQDQKDMVSVRGKFTLLKEQANDEKPLPKVVGSMDSKGVVYPVMVTQPSALSALVNFDNKEVSVTGRFLQKADKGTFLIVTEVVIPPAPPEYRKKRGGIP